MLYWPPLKHLYACMQHVGQCAVLAAHEAPPCLPMSRLAEGVGAETCTLPRLRLREAYLRVQHSANAETAAGTDPYLRTRTPDDSIRFHSFSFALVRVLDKVVLLARTVPVPLAVTEVGCVNFCFLDSSIHFQLFSFALVRVLAKVVLLARTVWAHLQSACKLGAGATSVNCRGYPGCKHKQASANQAQKRLYPSTATNASPSNIKPATVAPPPGHA